MRSTGRPEELAALDGSLRQAVASGAFAEAARLLRDYCRQLETAEEARHARELLEWIFRATSAARAHDLASLKQAAALSSYLTPARARARAIEVDG